MLLKKKSRDSRTKSLVKRPGTGAKDGLDGGGPAIPFMRF